MRDKVPHMGVINCALGLGLPRGMGGVVIGENADNMDIIRVAKCCFGRVDQFAAENKVQSLCHDILHRVSVSAPYPIHLDGQGDARRVAGRLPKNYALRLF